MRALEYGKIIEFLSQEMDVFRMEVIKGEETILYLWGREFPLIIYHDDTVGYSSKYEPMIDEWTADRSFFKDLVHIMDTIESILRRKES